MLVLQFQNIEFEKDNSYRGIKLNFQIFEDLDDFQVFCYRWKWGHATECEDILQTRDSAKNAQKLVSHLILSLGFYDMSFSWGYGWDISDWESWQAMADHLSLGEWHLEHASWYDLKKSWGLDWP